MCIVRKRVDNHELQIIFEHKIYRYIEKHTSEVVGNAVGLLVVGVGVVGNEVGVFVVGLGVGLAVEGVGLDVG